MSGGMVTGWSQAVARLASLAAAARGRFKGARTTGDDWIERRQTLRAQIEWLQHAMRNIDVLCFGDSVLERVSRYDRDRRTLGELIAGNLDGRLRVGCVSRTGYHVGVFRAFLRVLEALGWRPRMVVLPVNMRSFSPQWDLNPLWRYDDEIQCLEEYCQNPERGLREGRDRHDMEALMRSFAAIRVAYPLSPFSRIGEFRWLIATRRWSRRGRAFRQRQIFIFHYTHPLGMEHPKIGFLVDCLTLVEAMKVPCLVYVTPVNYQAGERYVGRDFRQVLAANVGVVREALGESGRKAPVGFANWAELLGSEYFFHADTATEHLNEEGRRILAGAIAEAVMERCPGAAGTGAG